MTWHLVVVIEYEKENASQNTKELLGSVLQSLATAEVMPLSLGFPRRNSLVYGRYRQYVTSELV